MWSVRVFFIGGLLAYRALFNWLSPWIFIPTLLLLPVFQILLFAFIGRAAHLESDSFYVIGDAVQGAATPSLVAMTSAIVGERFERTLGVILCTPARRVPMFLGRALPVVINAWAVSIFSLVVGSLLLNVHISIGAWLPLALVVLIACVSCTGFALILAGVGLRIRATAAMTNVTYGVLLIACGVNVPLAALPPWLRGVSDWLPLTHAIEAARELAGGKSLGSTADLLSHELLLAAGYILIGLLTLRVLENRSRINATLETA